MGAIWMKEVVDVEPIRGHFAPHILLLDDIFPELAGPVCTCNTAGIAYQDSRVGTIDGGNRGR